jgi:hypothetical protein
MVFCPSITNSTTLSGAYIFAARLHFLRALAVLLLLTSRWRFLWARRGGEGRPRGGITTFLSFIARGRPQGSLRGPFWATRYLRSVLKPFFCSRNRLSLLRERGADAGNIFTFLPLLAHGDDDGLPNNLEHATDCCSGAFGVSFVVAMSAASERLDIRGHHRFLDYHHSGTQQPHTRSSCFLLKNRDCLDGLSIAGISGPGRTTPPLQLRCDFVSQPGEHCEFYPALLFMTSTDFAYSHHSFPVLPIDILIDIVFVGTTPLRAPLYPRGSPSTSTATMAHGHPSS